MLRWRTVVSLCTLLLLLSLAAPTAAQAQEDPDVLSEVTIVSAVVDMETGVATVTISVTCLMDVSFLVRGAASLSQRYGSGRLVGAYTRGFGVMGGCEAGEVLRLPIVFYPVAADGSDGRFVPGPAEIDGWIEAIEVSPETGCCFSVDVESIGPTTVILRPA